jgi:hypothetical protein
MAKKSYKINFNYVYIKNNNIITTHIIELIMDNKKIVII